MTAIVITASRVRPGRIDVESGGVRMTPFLTRKPSNMVPRPMDWPTMWKAIRRLFCVQALIAQFPAKVKKPPAPIDPNAKITPGYPANVMPGNFGTAISPPDLTALVAFACGSAWFAYREFRAAELARQVGRAAEVAVAARDRDHRARGIDAWTGDQTLVDGALQSEGRPALRRRHEGLGVERDARRLPAARALYRRESHAARGGALATDSSPLRIARADDAMLFAKRSGRDRVPDAQWIRPRLTEQGGNVMGQLEQVGQRTVGYRGTHHFEVSFGRDGDDVRRGSQSGQSPGQ